jgi:hypothetical protein
MDYTTHWLMTAAAGFFFLLCAVTIRFFRTRASRSEDRPASDRIPNP